MGGCNTSQCLQVLSLALTSYLLTDRPGLNAFTVCSPSCVVALDGGAVGMRFKTCFLLSNEAGGMQSRCRGRRAVNKLSVRDMRQISLLKRARHNRLIIIDNIMHPRCEPTQHLDIEHHSFYTNTTKDLASLLTQHNNPSLGHNITTFLSPKSLNLRWIWL